MHMENEDFALFSVYLCAFSRLSPCNQFKLTFCYFVASKNIPNTWFDHRIEFLVHFVIMFFFFSFHRPKWNYFGYWHNHVRVFHTSSSDHSKFSNMNCSTIWIWCKLAHNRTFRQFRMVVDVRHWIFILIGAWFTTIFTFDSSSFCLSSDENWCCCRASSVEHRSSS